MEDGGKLLADYGSFQLYEVDHLRPEVLQAENAEVRDDSNAIFLNAASIDTSATAVKALRQPVGAFNGKRLHLVQFVGPMQNAWHEALKKTGARIISYLPENAYLVYGDAPSLAKLQRLAGTMTSLQWDGEYRDDYKIHPTARLVDANGNPQQLPTLTLIDRLKLEPIHRQYNLRQYVNVFVRLRAQDLGLVAAQPDVISIQPYLTPRKLDERQDQILAGNLTGNAPTAPGYLAWLTGKGFTQAQFTASGFAVALMGAPPTRDILPLTNSGIPVTPAVSSTTGWKARPTIRAAPSRVAMATETSTLTLSAPSTTGQPAFPTPTAPGTITTLASVPSSELGLR